jgi:hypothetical protein
MWPDTFVGDGSLHNLVYQLRAALNDGDHRIIRTIHGYGFAFGTAAAADDGRRPASHQLVIGDKEFDLYQGENLIGRDRSAAVRIDSTSVSRLHAKIIVDGNRVMLEDLGSKNGTTLSGRRLRDAADLVDGDRLLFGDISAVFRSLHAEPSTETIPLKK